MCYAKIVDRQVTITFPYLSVTQHVRNCGPQMFLISRKGGTLLTINNFVYRSNLKFFGKSNNILYWECVQNRSVKCRSRLKTIGDDLYVTNGLCSERSPFIVLFINISSIQRCAQPHGRQ